jgi:hypothetical protein
VALTVQTLTTNDGKSIAVAGIVVYSINDVLKAIGEKNYDVDDTLAEISKAAIVAVVNGWGLQDLSGDVPGIEKDLTKECRKQLRPFGVYVHRAALTDFTICRPISLLGMPDSIG